MGSKSSKNCVDAVRMVRSLELQARDHANRPGERPRLTPEESQYIDSLLRQTACCDPFVCKDKLSQALLSLAQYSVAVLASANQFQSQFNNDWLIELDHKRAAVDKQLGRMKN